MYLDTFHHSKGRINIKLMHKNVANASNYAQEF